MSTLKRGLLGLACLKHPAVEVRSGGRAERGKKVEELEETGYYTTRGSTIQDPGLRIARANQRGDTVLV